MRPIDGASGLRWMRIAVTLAAGVGVTGCARDETPEPQADCIRRNFFSYDAKRAEQCVAACKACMGGNTVTCSTSCKLKGAI